MFAEQRLNVVTVQEGVGASAGAAGNDVWIGGQGTDVSATSNQVNNYQVGAQTRVDVAPGGAAGASSNLSTTAIGNSGVASAAGSTYSGFMVQTNSGAVTARGQFEAEDAEAGDVAVDTLASANAQGVVLSNGSAGARISQANSGDVLADGGAITRYVTGRSDVSGAATGNAIELDGADQSAARIITDQGNTAALVQASQFAAYGNSYLTTTATTAAGNSVSATNTGPLLDVANHQYNTAYVRSQAEGASYDFGGAQADAYGVGNTAVAGNIGAALVVDNVQLNDGGGVEVSASAGGHNGYDIGASATAVGNSVSGYVCGACGGSLTANNSQTNNADVAARANTTVTGSARSVTGAATATGNSARFYTRSY